ncbi:hypothetical protein [Nocardia sp. NPDC058497]|uniref:hypothetical protein n=1 Tax=Nocardia sp. NPDC058497 TaxID=3346529 RepID=UPI00364AA250
MTADPGNLQLSAAPGWYVDSAVRQHDRPNNLVGSAMSAVKSAFTITAVTSGAVALAVATAAPAAASSKFNTIYSLTQGPCVAIVDTSINGNAYPSSAGFTVTTNMLGVGSCSLTVTLHWRNLDTQETGTFDVHASGPGVWMNGGPTAIFQPGFGNFVGWVTVNANHIGDSGEAQFEVNPYQG